MRLMFREEDYETCCLRMQEEELAPAQDERYQSFIVKYNQNVYGTGIYTSDSLFQVINDYFAIVYTPLENGNGLELTSYSYNSIPKCYTYMDTEALNASGVTRLHEHPYLRLRGKGTVVAVIDSGIDYTNPVFQDGNGSRVLCLWDQTIPGKGNEGVPFGRVFTKKEIDEALSSEDPLSVVPSMDTNGHGTMVAGVAAGSRVEEEDFSGAAPEASLIVVKLKQAKNYLRDFYLLPSNAEIFQEDDIMLALSFAMEQAKEYRMPLSVCLGLGTSQGAHLGYSPLSQFASSTASFSQNSISIAAGNEGMARHHFEGNIEKGAGEVTAELRIGEDTRGFTMELWGEPPESYQITIQSPTGENLEVSTAVKAAEQELSFVFVETKILVNYIAIERQSGNSLVFFRFLHPAAGLWRIKVRGGNREGSRFHIWLPVKGLLPEGTYFLQSSPYNTVTSPGDSLECMTVTAYQYRDNSLFLEASRGFTPIGSVKPNFAAPGVGIRVPLLKGGFGEASGSSLAAAATAGIAALMFEWAVIRENEPFFSGNSVKNYLQSGARRDEGVVYPNPEWGYGRVDLYHTFELLT